MGFHQVTLEIGQSARPDLPQLYPNNLTNPVQKCPTWHKITPDLHHQKRLKWGFYGDSKPLKVLITKGFIYKCQEPDLNR
ncbi:hypothetical protein NIES592_00875 [Fischerella major NIES-592]|uniref:Uncharacterized protein n=1 Tax=Fischerella major NIES-592 TaxID=210994 RepID=A0A1U7H4Q3_9CYAN|nr:hypothetical protein NIES592_00875 [Fischerella major NIES-592]